MMKKLFLTGLLVSLFATPILAADKKEKTEKKAKPYPLEVCLVSDEKLDSMGEPFVFVHEGQEIKLCCKPCQKDFNKDTKTYLKKLDKAAKAKKKA